MGAVRAGAVAAGFAGLTIPLLPVQSLLLRVSRPWARIFPHWYHRQICKILGLRMHVEGEIVRDAPLLVVANHTSWLDIPVLSALAPVSFIAKREVKGWPGVSLLARLQQTVYVDRERRAAVGETTNEIRSRLTRGDALVLFAEGTSSDGNRVLPFRSSLFGAVMPPRQRELNEASAQSTTDETCSDMANSTVVQTVTFAYTRVHGIPIDRADRAKVGWYGDMEMLSHAWSVLKNGPLDVVMKVGKPIPVQEFKDRKAIARHTEDEVRRNHVRILGHAHEGDDFETVRPGAWDRSTPVDASDPQRSRTSMR